MADLKYSPEVLRDLDEIWEYINSDLSNPDAADHTVNAILDKTEDLREFPYIGAPLDTISRIHSNYHFIPVNNFLVFYRVQDGAVYIDRILYGRRNCLRILLGIN